jgi:hypothetical protein
MRTWINRGATDMALLITVDNRPIFVDSKTANALWLVKTGERSAKLEVRTKVQSISKWYLNRDTAPESYIMQNPEMVERRIRGSKQTVSQGRLPYID